MLLFLTTLFIHARSTILLVEVPLFNGTTGAVRRLEVQKCEVEVVTNPSSHWVNSWSSLYDHRSFMPLSLPQLIALSGVGALLLGGPHGSKTVLAFHCLITSLLWRVSASLALALALFLRSL